MEGKPHMAGPALERSRPTSTASGESRSPISREIKFTTPVKRDLAKEASKIVLGYQAARAMANRTADVNRLTRAAVERTQQLQELPTVPEKTDEPTPIRQRNKASKLGYGIKAAAVGVSSILVPATAAAAPDSSAVNNAVNNRTAIVEQFDRVAQLGVPADIGGNDGPNPPGSEPEVAGVDAAQGPPYWSLENGIFFPQEGSRNGFAVTDQMLGAYRNMGGFEAWGRPISRAYEDENGRLSQAFEGGIFHLSEGKGEQVQVANLTDEVIPQEALTQHQYVRGEPGQPGVIAEIPAGEVSVAGRGTERATELGFSQEIEIGPGSFIYNLAGDVGVDLAGSVSEREENLRFIQSMFEKYGGGRQLKIFIRRDVPTHIPQGIDNYSTLVKSGQPVYSLHGSNTNGMMELHYVLKPGFDELQGEFNLSSTIRSKVWVFLAAYKFMPRNQWEGNMLRNNPEGTGILPLPDEMARDLTALSSGRFATYSSGNVGGK